MIENRNIKKTRSKEKKIKKYLCYSCIKRKEFLKVLKDKNIFHFLTYCVTYEQGGWVLKLFFFMQFQKREHEKLKRQIILKRYFYKFKWT